MPAKPQQAHNTRSSYKADTHTFTHTLTHSERARVKEMAS